jgi:hypothetical protein
MRASPVDVSQKVRRFHATYSFPGYGEFERLFDLREKVK